MPRPVAVHAAHVAARVQGTIRAQCPNRVLAPVELQPGAPAVVAARAGSGGEAGSRSRRLPGAPCPA